MAHVGVCTDKGRKKTNQDACCVKVAKTTFGEVVMAVICDGVGGLSLGELASATVVHSFVTWFDEELPALLDGMDRGRRLDFDMVQMVWGIRLAKLNEMIRAHGMRTQGGQLGTTFSGILLCGDRYLVGHVGDCRIYQLGSRGFRQLTEDQTLLAKKLASGELSPEEAKTFSQRHVILQSVGTEGLLKPSFYQGVFSAGDLFVLCCDGAYRKAEDRGLDSFFGEVDGQDDHSITDACRKMAAYDLSQGEKDNLTVLCISPKHEPLAAAVIANDDSDELPTMVDEDDGLVTMVQSGEPDDPGELATMVDEGDDLVTMVQSDAADGADDASSPDEVPTMVESLDEDLPTMDESEVRDDAKKQADRGDA